MTTVRAAVLHGPNQALEIAELELAPPAPARCSSGTARAASATPTCTSSTASGRRRTRSCSATRAPASSRRSARASPTSPSGDHVVLSWWYPCGTCLQCRRGEQWVCSGNRATDNTLHDGTTRLSSRRRRRSASTCRSAPSSTHAVVPRVGRRGDPARAAVRRRLPDRLRRRHRRRRGHQHRAGDGRLVRRRDRLRRRRPVRDPGRGAGRRLPDHRDRPSRRRSSSWPARPARRTSIQPAGSVRRAVPGDRARLRRLRVRGDRAEGDDRADAAAHAARRHDGDGRR